MLSQSVLKLLTLFCWWSVKLRDWEKTIPDLFEVAKKKQEEEPLALMSPLVSGGPGAVVAAHFFPHTPAHALRSEHVKVNTIWISCCGLIGGLNFTLLFFRSEHLFSGYGRTRDFSR